MRPFFLSIFLLSFLFSSPAGAAEAEAAPSEAVAVEPEVVVELDAYYSDVGLHVPLTDRPIPNVGESDELSVYRHLFLNSLTPRFFLVEASVFPMPILGVYLKKNHRDFYDSTGVEGVNLLESVTAGFQEPYALSIFFGDIVNFVKEGETRKGTNKGYMGYLVSYATRHIKNNIMVQDDSWELEWKLKGDRVFNDEKLTWSFRLGAKLHEHPEITDTAYLGLRRSSLDFNSPVLSWLKNSSFDFKWDFSTRNGNMLRQEYTVGKKYPLQSLRLALKLDFGLIWQSYRSYTGSLRDLDHHTYTIVFRPNLEF